MGMKHIRSGRPDGATAELREATFSGTVWGDPMIAPSEGVTVNTVHFAPCARTHWHRHPEGQLIQVVAGKGWIVERDGRAFRLLPGDWVWSPPGTEHWHGADVDAPLVHVAITIGDTTWLDAVTDDQYDASRETSS